MFILFGGLTCVAAYVADISFLILPLRLLVAAAAFVFFGFGVYFDAHTVRQPRTLRPPHACAV